MKKTLCWFLFSIFSFALSLFAASPSITFSVDTEIPSVFEVQTYAGNTPTITVNIQSGGSNFTGLGAGWSAEFNYSKSDYATALKTITGTVNAATGVVTFNCATNAFPASGDYFGEIFLQNGSTKITSGQGLVRVKKSPSSGSTTIWDLNNRVNWDILTSIGNLPWSDFDTNTLQSQITANLASANATSVVFQAKFDAQANTNADYESRIAAEETLSTAQANTNAALLAAIVANGTSDVSLVTYNAHVAAQAATNTEVYTFRTNQVATNAALLAAITANGTSDVSLVTYNAHVTAQATTNTEFESRIGSNETFRITTQPATNASLLAQAAYGITAYGWGDWSGQGFITSATNIFTSLYVADRSQLDANISGLTQGVYTGSLTTVAYTGATALVSGKTYVYGYSKVGASGTSTLSIAGFTLGPHTAVNNYSNYFSFEDTGSNLVIKLDGSGLSLCNASNIYVRASTGGTINAAGDMNVGGVIRAYGAIMTNPAVHIADTANPHGVTASQAGAVATNDADYLVALTNARPWDEPNYNTITNPPTIPTTNGFIKTGEAGAWTNLSEYNDDLASSSTNLSDYNNDVPFVTGTVVRAEVDPVFTASVAYAISEGDTQSWTQGASDASTATNFIGTNTLQTQITANAGFTNYAFIAWNWGNWATNLLNWAMMTGTPTTIGVGGYGVTDVYTKVQSDATYATTGTVGVIDVAFSAHTNNESADIQHLTAAEKAHAAAAITNEPHSIAYSNLTYSSILQSMTNFTSVASSSNYLTYDPVTRLLSGCVTNAGAGGTGTTNASGINVAFTPTNYTADKNVESHLQGLDGIQETNRVSFGGESNVDMRIDGTNVYFGAPEIANLIAASNLYIAADNAIGLGATNLALAIGLGASNYADTVGAAVGLGATNYGLVIGLGASNYADSVGTVVSNSYTNTAVLAAAALPKAGGTMTGALTNDVAYWLPVNGTVYFGTITNYIKDQGGTNFLFMSGTNSANFGW